MNGIVTLSIFQFSLIYLLLLIVLGVMKKAKINQDKLLIMASFRMTIQLVLAGFILTYIFENPHPLFTFTYVGIMIVFSIKRVLSKYPDLNQKFKTGIVLAISLSGLFVLTYFVVAVVREDLANPQYTIPLAGMILGNSMTGVTLALNKFTGDLRNQRDKINALINFGAHPKKVLMPFVNTALETALLPTMNSMLGLGIVSLPGMMTGQILSGTLPTTAIMYQIAIMIAITTTVCLSTFISLYLGYRTLYDQKLSIHLEL